MEPVQPGFFDRPTLELARALLGMHLVCITGEGMAAGRIVETEAYIGPIDRAAHTYGNRRTPRTEVMFGPPGHAYVYVMHTHSLFNVTSGEEGSPEAVLVRAVEPCAGLELMEQRRGPVKRVYDLTNGPGKLTKALGITKADYGRPLTEPPLFIALGSPVKNIAVGTRVGIEGSGEAQFYPWRFWEDGNPYVSKGRGAVLPK